MLLLVWLHHVNASDELHLSPPRRTLPNWFPYGPIQGVYTFAGGDRYVGTVKNGAMHGHGVYTYFAAGTRYVGEWKNSQYDGLGEIEYKDGRRFSGTFRRGKKHGRGVYTYPAGDTLESVWDDGVEDEEERVLNRNPEKDEL